MAWIDTGVQHISMPATTEPLLAAASPTEAGFADWMRPHWSDMAGLASRLAVPGEWEDVLQDALDLAWRRRAQFDPARGSARAWLLTITANVARKSWRRARPDASLPNRDSAVLATDSSAAMDLARSVATLTDRQRLAVELYYYLGLPVTEVAAAMDCAEGTVKSTLADARVRLRSTLGEDYR